MSQASWRRGNIFSLLNDEKAEDSASTTKAAAKALQTLNPNTVRQQMATGKNIIPAESTFKNRPGKTEPGPAAFKGLTTETTEKFKPQEAIDKRRILPHSEDRRSRTGMDPNIRRKGAGPYNWGETIEQDVERMHEIKEDEMVAQAEISAETPIDKEGGSPELVTEKPEENFVTFSEYVGSSEEKQTAQSTQTGLLSFKPPQSVTTKQRPKERKSPNLGKAESEKPLNFQDSSTFPALS
jgi:hypothetical protein